MTYLPPDLLNLKKKKKVGTSLVVQWLGLTFYFWGPRFKPLSEN